MLARTAVVLSAVLCLPASPTFAQPMLGPAADAATAAVPPPDLPAPRDRARTAAATVCLENRAGLLNVRDAAGTGGRVLATLRHGETVRIAGRDGRWVRVALPGGGTGYAAGRFLCE